MNLEMLQKYLVAFGNVETIFFSIFDMYRNKKIKD